MGTTQATAFGKIILLGEHAVVYGVPAIAAAIDRGASACVTPLAQGPSRLRVPDWEVDVTANVEEHDLARAFRAVLDATGVKQPVLVEARADLPPGAGLGCSAALGVAVVRALDPTVAEERVAERAMAWERVFHGTPSGVDAAVAAAGGCLQFEKGKPTVRVRVRGTLTLCIGSTGRASSTKSMVESVARMRARRPEVVAKIWDGIAALVSNARLAVEAGDTYALGRLMDLNQMLLSGLFVSTDEIERLCDLARNAGALGAKLTGAGGGGSVIALVPSEAVAQRVITAWKGEGFDGFATRVIGAEAREGIPAEREVVAP